jgi:hypothetical protein
VASCLWHGAVQACVIGGAGEGRRAQERDPCAACSGQPDDVDLARSRGGARGVSPVSATGNWFVVSMQAWRRGAGQRVDGGVLTGLGCPRWPWRLAGRRGVLV